MFCKNCGTELNGNFCTKCGTSANEQVENQVKSFDIPLETLERAYGIYGKNKLGFSSYLATELHLSYKEANKIRDEYLSTKANEKAPSFFKKLANQVSYNSSDIQKEKRDRKQKIADNKSNGIACCPKCGSTSLSGNKKGFGIGKAVVGASLTGGLGLIAGNVGAKKVRITCMNCGHDFFAGKQ